MSKSAMDIDMVSPPPSPRTSSSDRLDTHPLTQPRSTPVPIAAKSPRPSSRFQPPIHKSSSPAFTPATPYHQSMFKPKTSRSSSTFTKNHSQSLQNHNAPSFQTSSPFHPHQTPSTSQHTKTPTPSPPHPTQTDPPAAFSSSRAHDLPNFGRDLKRTAPLQIPGSFKSSPDIRRQGGRSVGLPNFQPNPLASPSNSALPHSLPNLSPSFPATLFGGLSADDEHVTVWEPTSGKTVAGNAAPYRRNLAAWLEAHPGWEEKADELKSSKRRSAARRSRAAADAFAALCCYPVATLLANEAARYLRALGNGDHCNEEAMMMWTNDDFVRLQEALFRLGQDIHVQTLKKGEVDEGKWAQVSAQIGGSKMQGAVVYCAHHMLTRGIAKSQREMGSNKSARPSLYSGMGMNASGESLVIGSPGSVGSHENGGMGIVDTIGPSSLPVQVGLGASFLERSFRAPREPRVTVWNPRNGRTISGNAAPCRKNLEAWMKQHPGWCPKEEGQLSSSRRNRNRNNGRFRPSSLPAAPEVGPSSVEPESPHFHDALQGLLCLSRSPSVGVSPLNSLTADVQLEEQVARAEAEIGNSRPMSRMESVEVMERGRVEAKKLGMTSSVSSSSAEDAEGISDGEDMSTSAMEL